GIARSECRSHLAIKSCFRLRNQQDISAWMQRIKIALTDRPRQFKIKTESRSATGVACSLSKIVHATLAKPFGKILERRIGVNRTMTRRDRRRFHEASEIERATRLRAGARQAAPAERLHADNRANDIPVDIDVPDTDTIRDICDGFVKAGMQTKSKPVT